MIPGNRLFIFEYKIGPYDIYRFVFYSKNPRLTKTDFINSLKEIINKLMEKYKRRDPMQLLNIASVPIELKRLMNQKGFAPIENYNYTDLNEVLQS